MRPNLFDFATSELSQDAFLCWVIANANGDDACDMRDLGRAFIAWLWERARGERIAAADVRLIAGPFRQVSHADVVFDVEISGSTRTFLIEDKTSTSQHSGQLQRYVEVLGRDRDLVPVYFKTGYHFSIDASASAHGYAVIGLSEWVAFLEAHPIRNDIYEDYVACMARRLSQREAVISALFTAAGHEQLGTDFAQFEFVTRLAASCADAIGPPAINRGVSVGGAPWTHYRFATFKAALPDGCDEALFHRIDARSDDAGKRRFYLSTRQYAVVKGNPAARAGKLLRLRQHSDAFRRAIEGGSFGLQFARPSTDRQGANESEIAILFFDGSTNTVPDVLQRFGAVHAAFVRELRRAGSG